MQKYQDVLDCYAEINRQYLDPKMIISVFFIVIIVPDRVHICVKRV